MPVVVTLGACWVQSFIAFFVVGFLEQNVRANFCFFKHAIFIYGSSGNIYVNAPDSAIFMLDGIDGMHAFQDVFNRVVLGVFACFYGKALVAHILQGNYFSANFVLRKLATRYFAVLCMVRAVQTTIHAVIRKI